MNKSLRKLVIAGNWKMNKSPIEARKLLTEMVELLSDLNNEVVICTPFVDLNEALSVLKNTNIKVGAQNCHYKDCGAYTGEISPSMLKSMGVEYVIIGHSERRNYFNETDIAVNQKVKAAIDAGLKVIICVGETLEQRELNITKNVISIQTYAALFGLNREEMKNVIIAYEPVWAIGTGKTATAEQANEVCLQIRDLVTSLYGKDIADSLTIQYGGSMNAKNAQELLAQENIDGGLIGGASLKAHDFYEIVKAGC